MRNLIISLVALTAAACSAPEIEVPLSPLIADDAASVDSLQVTRTSIAPVPSTCSMASESCADRPCCNATGITDQQMVCERRPGTASPVCCQPSGGTCRTDDDCCGGFGCYGYEDMRRCCFMQGMYTQHTGICCPGLRYRKDLDLCE